MKLLVASMMALSLSSPACFAEDELGNLLNYGSSQGLSSGLPLCAEPTVTVDEWRHRVGIDRPEVQQALRQSSPPATPERMSSDEFDALIEAHPELVSDPPGSEPVKGSGELDAFLDANPQLYSEIPKEKPSDDIDASAAKVQSQPRRHGPGILSALGHIAVGTIRVAGFGASCFANGMAASQNYYAYRPPLYTASGFSNYTAMPLGLNMNSISGFSNGQPVNLTQMQLTPSMSTINGYSGNQPVNLMSTQLTPSMSSISGFNGGQNVHMNAMQLTPNVTSVSGFEGGQYHNYTLSTFGNVTSVTGQ